MRFGGRAERLARAVVGPGSDFNIAAAGESAAGEVGLLIHVARLAANGIRTVCDGCAAPVQRGQRGSGSASQIIVTPSDGVRGGVEAVGDQFLPKRKDQIQGA